MSKIGNFVLLGTVSLAAMGSTSAMAQKQAQPDAAAKSKPTVATEPSNGDIIVTAQRRAESVQRVPVTVAVVSDKALAQQNLVSTSDLVQTVPALTVTNFGVFQIRSLGTQGFGKSAEQSVSVVIDGVPMPRPQAYELSNGLFDVDRVEVLSGPQGTLFGKNASAGVINLVTKAPELNKFAVIGHLDVGNHDVVNANLAVNIPLGDNAALRVVGHHNAYGHLVFNTLFNKWDKSRDDGVRARLRWEPTDNLRIDLSGDYQHLETNGVNGLSDFAGVAVYRSASPGSDAATALAGCGIVASPKNRKVCGDTLYDPNVPRGNAYGANRGGGSLQVDWDFAEGYTLTSISAIRHDVTGDFDVDAELAGGFGDTLPINFLQRNLFPTSLKMFSQETRIQSPAGNRLNFVAGVYYSNIRSHDHIDQTGAFNLPLGGLEFRRVNDVRSRATNYAAFGQLNFDITPELRFIAGARVTRDKLRTYSENTFPDAVPDGPFIYTGNTGFFSLLPINTCVLAGGNPDIPSTCPAGTSLTEPAKISKTGFTGKIGLQYTFNPRTMAYATYTRGYKGPFINDQASWPVTSPLVVAPEKPDAYEIGLKTKIFDRINLSVALFNTKANGFQTTIFIPSENSGTAVDSFFQGNTRYVITRGVDIGLLGNITDNLSFNASLLYNEAHYNRGFLVPCTTETDGSCEARKQLPFAPKWKGTFSAEYRHDISDRVQGFLQSDVNYSSGYPYGSGPFPDATASKSRTLLGARTGLRFDDDRWSVAVFCRNCLNKRYPAIVTPFNSSLGVGETMFLQLSSFRVFGLTLDGKF